MKGYGNSPDLWPKTWTVFAILAPKLGITIDESNQPFAYRETLIAWNWFLEGIRCAKGKMSLTELRTELEGPSQ